MTISTKSGDDGYTNLPGRPRVLKNDAIIEALGNLDELNASIGIAKLYLLDGKYKNFLEEIQNDILAISAYLIAPQHDIDLPGVDKIDKIIKYIEANHQIPAKFICPGKNQQECLLHLARTTSRKTERSIVAIQNYQNAQKIIPFVNRLSDALWLIASIQ